MSDVRTEVGMGSAGPAVGGGSPAATSATLRWALPALAVAGAAAYVALLVSASGGFGDHDVFVMARVARDVLDGKALYAQAWDNKAPLAILFYALPVAIAPGSYPALQAWLGLWLVAQAALAWWGLGRESGAARWLVPALLLLLPLQRAEWCWASSEHAGNLFVLVALLVGWRVAVRGVVRWPELAAAGAATTLAFNVRQNQVLFGLVPVLAVLAARRAGALRPLAAFAAGVAVAWAAVLALVLVASHGDLAGYLRTVFLAPAAYGRSWGEVALLLVPLRQDLTLFLILASALVALTGARRGLAATLGVTTLAMMLLPMRGYPHYWVQAFPAAALLAALAVEALGILPTRRAALHGALAAALLAGVGLMTVHDLASSGERARLDAVAASIRPVLGGGDATLLAMGELSAYLYFATGAPTTHPIFWQNWMFGSLRAVLPVPLEEVLRAYAERPPSVIALDEDTAQRVLHAPAPDEELDVPLVRRLLASERYAEVSRQGGWHILRR